MSLSINTTEQQFYDLLKDCIEKELPLAVTRIGDGEIHILRGTAPPALLKRFCSYNGYNWQTNSVECMKVSKTILLKALKGSDVIGILDKNSVMGKRVYKNSWVLPAEFLQGNEPKICDHQITRGPILGNVTQFKKILNGKGVHIISSHTDALKKNRLAQRLGVKISYTQVPFRTNIKNRVWLFRKLDTIPEPVVLVGIGVKGKDIPIYLRDRGKICMDWGATLDAWAGIVSRPWFQNVQGHCLIKQ
jgi:hypothetical protein